MDKIPKKIKMINHIKKFIKINNLDGYIIPKNDIYFNEYSENNNLRKISNFTGSAGFALILKKKNYLFVDGRYTLQAKIESGRNFTICQIPYFLPKNLDYINKNRIGFDPKLFTEDTLNKYFADKIKLVPISYRFDNKKKGKNIKYFGLSDKITGENYISKVNKVSKILKKNNTNFLYVSASENVCWLLNIRGKDLPNSPVANCKLLVCKNKNLYLFANDLKVSNLKKKFKKKTIFCNEKDFFKIISKFKKGNICIDKNTCSIFEQELIKSKFNIISDIDPIYKLKSIKNNIEIKNMIKSHIVDGVALTKFLYWFKKQNKSLTELKIEKKLEKFRKKSKLYLYPSFETIAGSGPNGAIIHYRANNKTNRKLKKNDILLLDSGGQYKWGTTDVTRTTFVGSISKQIKNNFTRVLKGHIAVATCNLGKYNSGYLIDKKARKPLNEENLDYQHGTGHGVGFFLNVHEGPQGITNNNKIILEQGMVLSNEPGYYLKNKYGIRIENLVYVDKVKNNLIFKNLTYVPIDMEMVNTKLLSKKEKDYILFYHLSIYSNISKFLNNEEKKWLLSLIKKF